MAEGQSKLFNKRLVLIACTNRMLSHRQIVIPLDQGILHTFCDDRIFDPQQRHWETRLSHGAPLC